jgi:hypothetical protein
MLDCEERVTIVCYDEDELKLLENTFGCFEWISFDNNFGECGTEIGFFVSCNVDGFQDLPCSSVNLCIDLNVATGPFLPAFQPGALTYYFDYEGRGVRQRDIYSRSYVRDASSTKKSRWVPCDRQWGGACVGLLLGVDSCGIVLRPRISRSIEVCGLTKPVVIPSVSMMLGAHYGGVRSNSEIAVFNVPVGTRPCFWLLREQGTVGSIVYTDGVKVYRIIVPLVDGPKNTRIYGGWAMVDNDGMMYNAWFAFHYRAIITKIRILTHYHCILDKYGCFTYYGEDTSCSAHQFMRVAAPINRPIGVLGCCDAYGVKSYCGTGYYKIGEGGVTRFRSDFAAHALRGDEPITYRILDLMGYAFLFKCFDSSIKYDGVIPRPREDLDWEALSVGSGGDSDSFCDSDLHEFNI